MKNYSTVIESLADIVLTVNKREVDFGLNQTLTSKIRFLIENIQDFKDIYIGNYYCPEVIKFLLREFQFIRTGENLPAEEVKKPKVEEKKEPEMFRSTLEKLQAFTVGMD